MNIPRANGKSLLSLRLGYQNLVEIAAKVCSRRYGCCTDCTNCANTKCFENFVNSELDWKLIDEYTDKYKSRGGSD